MPAPKSGKNAIHAAHMRELWSNPEFRARMLSARQGVKCPNTSKRMLELWADPGQRQKMLEARDTPEVKRALSDAMRQRFGNPTFAARHRVWTSNTMRELNADPGFAQRRSRASDLYWSDPAKRVEQAERAAAVMRSAKHKDTWIERWVFDVLTRAGVQFDPQAKIYGYPGVPDFLVKHARLVIEVDGTYWHSFPNIQKKDQHKDRLLGELGYTVIRVQEADIQFQPEAVEQRLLAALEVIRGR